MIFNKLILNNIGAYYGPQEFDFNIITKDQNIVLIGGKNGAGKTTLLDSLRLCLYGPYAFGLKTESDLYLKKVTSMLNTEALRRNETLYQLILEFEMVENYEKRKYRIRRDWDLSSGKPKENLQVMRDDYYLNTSKTEVFLTKLNEEFPPKLFEFCLFDGEEVSRIISEDILSDYLRAIANVVFSLDLFQNLESDLGQFLKQTNPGSASGDEKALQEAQDQVRLLLEKENTLNHHQHTLTSQAEELQIQLTVLKRNFETSGGLIKEKRDQLMAQMHELEHIRQGNQEKIKDFIASLLPFYISRDLLTNVKQQMVQEQAQDNYDYIKKTLKPEDLKVVLEDFIKATGFSSSVINSENNLEETLLSSFLKALKPLDLHIIHRASFQQRHEIEHILHLVQSVDPKGYIKLFNENSKRLKEIQSIRKQIEQNDQTSELSEFINQIEQLSKELEILRMALDRNSEALENVQQELSLIQKDVENYKLKVLQSNRSENIFSMTTAVIEISQRFITMQLRKKLTEVESQTLRILNQVFRKDHYFSALKLDPQSFELTLYDRQHQVVNKTKLSAGEKQILLLALIAAMVKCSSRKLPFVFDTLLGRLDKTHRATILQNLIPYLSEQVIILSTDSEIDQEHFPYIEPFLARCYTLEYLNSEHQINIENGYFSLRKTEAVG